MVNFRLHTSIIETEFNIFLILLAHIIRVYFLYHCVKYFFPCIYVNIQNIILCLIDKNPVISLWVYFDKLLHLTESPGVSSSQNMDSDQIVSLFWSNQLYGGV